MDIRTAILKVSLVFLLPLLTQCGGDTQQRLQGYVEGEYLYLAAPQAGYLQTLDARRGIRVAQGQTLFVIDAAPDDAALAEAQAHVQSAQAKLQNLQQPRRASEIAAINANLHAADASLHLADTQLQQQLTLLPQKLVSQAKVDETRAARDQAAAQVRSLKEQLATYQSSLGRAPEVQAAAAEMDAAEAVSAQRSWIITHKTVNAPAAGEIADTFYQPGEWVPAGAPVASLLPDTRRKLRFFIPEKLLASVATGDVIEASCDGCGTVIRATIDFVAASAEYTPPVIYSRDSREKLVFRVEAVASVADAKKLRPGLPLDIRLVQPHER